MSSNYFDHIEQELILLQQRLMFLKAENADLRQQLTILRSGQGILLEIGGQRFSVLTEQATNKTTHPLEISQQEALPVQEPEYAAVPAFPDPQFTEQGENLGEEGEKQIAVSTFLEEVLLDEFTVATTNNPLATWTGPITPIKKKEQIDEDRKATLRRELMGSFLLE